MIDIIDNFALPIRRIKQHFVFGNNKFAQFPLWDFFSLFCFVSQCYKQLKVMCIL